MSSLKNETVWWKEQLRIIQYNLQVQDTPKMEPVRIAENLQSACANTVVLNAGGIYAWYESRVPYHHVNEFLPAGRDLFAELIDACHRRGIRVIARFDFSKAEDTVFLAKPHWFVRKADGKPLLPGSGRMGKWSLLASTCVNGGYRNLETAVPILNEALECYDIDGVFYNAPQMEDCWCGSCRRKYRSFYQTELPEQSADWETEWKERCLEENLGLLYRTVKTKKPEVPVILYYGTYHKQTAGSGQKSCRPDGQIVRRYETADLICTEAQDILSAGVGALPEIWKPWLNMRLGSLEGYPKPCGIIHSCPGMDWRHTGLPTAEHRFWMSQIPAAGGQLWHSLTGFEDTITDKRQLDSVRWANQTAQSFERLLQDTEYTAQILLLWNGGRACLGWTEGLMQMRLPFDLMDFREIDFTRMEKYEIVIVPDQYQTDERLAETLRRYTEQGGKLVIEKSSEKGYEYLSNLMGYSEDSVSEMEVSAAYLRLETEEKSLRRELEETELIGLKGSVLCTELREGSLLLSLVPPFAPPDGVGAPPERASLPLERTEIPMAAERKNGRGACISLFFGLSGMMLDYHLEDHYLLCRNLMEYLLESRSLIQIDTHLAGIFCGIWRGETKLLLQLVNGIGQRPLTGAVICQDLKTSVLLPDGKQAVSVTAVSAGKQLEWKERENRVQFCLPQLGAWEMICIEIK